MNRFSIQSEMTRDRELRRTTIGADRRRLTWIGAGFWLFAALWLLLAASALATGGLSNVIVLPASLALAVVSGWIALWALRRGGSNEAAVIVDEVGLFDNVSLAGAGRVRWEDAERMWIAGPRWLPLLCILPQGVRGYIESRTDSRRVAMRFGQMTLGAPIVIPVFVLDATREEVRRAIGAATGRLAPTRPDYANFVTGS